MRSVTTEPNQPSEPKSISNLQTFSATLSDGREITIREMTGRDLIYMEEDLAEYGETRRSFYLVERLNIGPVKVTFDEVADMGARDLKVVSELVKKANGGEEEESGNPK